MHLLFAGTPIFAATILAGLVASRHHVNAVLTQPDRPAGRGLKPRPSAVKTLALERDIPVLQPTSLKSPSSLDSLNSYRCDVLIVAAYGLLLPSPVLEFPKHCCINVHASLLPRWRGAAPIQRAILAGDTRSGVSIMQMDKGLDTGPVFAFSPCAIDTTDTAGSLHDRLCPLGTSALLDVLERCEHEDWQTTDQDNRQASYAHRIVKSEASLDWTLPATHLERMIRAFNPWPIAYSVSQRNQARLRVWRAELGARTCRYPPGHVEQAAAAGLDIATGDGVLRLLTVQPSGRKPMPVRDYLNANRLEVGEPF